MRKLLVIFILIISISPSAKAVEKAWIDFTISGIGYGNGAMAFLSVDWEQQIRYFQVTGFMRTVDGSEWGSIGSCKLPSYLYCSMNVENRVFFFRIEGDALSRTIYEVNSSGTTIDTGVIALSDFGYD